MTFTLAAIEAGKHVRLQTPMATNMDDVHTDAMRVAGNKALAEPSANSPLEPDYVLLHRLVRQDMLGDILLISRTALLFRLK